MRIQWDPDAQAHIDAAIAAFFMDELGPAIRDDAKRLCPKRTGSLADSIERHVEGLTLIVSASGSQDRDYALYVESGHRIYHPSTKTAGPDVKTPSPFLRPALYQQRAA